jgi:hypothetical protein
MKRIHRQFKRSAVTILIAAAVLFGVLATSAAANGNWPSIGCTEGVLDSQQILTCIPASGFNGDLVMYAHGYVAPQLPLALPEEELGPFVDIIPLLNSQGFAFATTSYSANGYVIETADEDLMALADHVNAQL